MPFYVVLRIDADAVAVGESQRIRVRPPVDRGIIMRKVSRIAPVCLGLLASVAACSSPDPVKPGAGGVGGVGGGTASSSSSSGNGGEAGAGGTGGMGGGSCVPVDDGNSCTDDVCENGVPAHPTTKACTDPSILAPPLDPTVVTTFPVATEFCMPVRMPFRWVLRLGPSRNDAWRSFAARRSIGMTTPCRG